MVSMFLRSRQHLCPQQWHDTVGYVYLAAGLVLLAFVEFSIWSVPARMFFRRKSILKEGGLQRVSASSLIGMVRGWRSIVILFTLNAVNGKQKYHYYSARHEPVRQTNGGFAEMMLGAVREGEGERS